MSTSAAPLEMLYDAECGICTRTKRRVERLDGDRGRIRAVALQDATPPEGVTRTDLERALHVVDTGTGEVAAGWDAVVAIARRIPALAWLSPVARVPGVSWLGARGYRWIAENRRSAACVSTPQDLRPASRETSAPSA